MGGFRTGGPPEGTTAIEIVKNAIDAGYRHIDTARGYGNEQAIGRAVNDVITEGKVNRKDIFITTKIYSKRQNVSWSRTEALAQTRQSLTNLNMSYVDLMLIHYPSNNSQLNSHVWSGLEDALNQGLVKSIGVSNFNEQQLQSLIQTANVFPAINQIESHPQLSQRQLIDYCRQFKTRVTAYSPLGAGSLITHPVLTQIGNTYNKTAVQVMLRWQIQRGVIVIPKTTKKHRMTENINLFDFSLTSQQINQIQNI
ncbi:uncharacterized oxidoreductase YtbE-like [Oppia nitens]|uniref:uncharacterized oxidoreductase YtbE-like n=1 Tax=Oppia nitens TaxID=1686743 RepID=UPI0023DBB73E|nr:uncharacterized oxidoreductase YtbE-like [Oppia nitens]